MHKDKNDKGKISKEAQKEYIIQSVLYNISQTFNILLFLFSMMAGMCTAKGRFMSIDVYNVYNTPCN